MNGQCAVHGVWRNARGVKDSGKPFPQTGLSWYHTITSQVISSFSDVLGERQFWYIVAPLTLEGLKAWFAWIKWDVTNTSSLESY